MEVDTLGDIDVEFTYSVADVTDIERRNTSYSKTITLPSTSKNQGLFGNILIFRSAMTTTLRMSISGQTLTLLNRHKHKSS